MNKPVIDQAGDGEGLRERQKQEERHQGHAQLVYHSSLKMWGGGKISVTTQDSGMRKTFQGMSFNINTTIVPDFIKTGHVRGRPGDSVG